MFKKIANWIEEHETEITVYSIIALFILLEYGSLSVAFDKGVSEGLKIGYLDCDDMIEWAVDKGYMVLKAPTDSGKLVETMDYDKWASIMSDIILETINN